MFEYKTAQIINAPISEVFTFFENPENLERITPTNLGFKIKTPRPLVMREGATFEYTISLGLIKFQWKTIITLYEPPNIFRDVQAFGPYKKWEHTHEFIEVGNKTKIIDTVHYDLFPGILKNIINKFIIRKRVNNIFIYRESILNRIFNKDIELEGELDI